MKKVMFVSKESLNDLQNGERHTLVFKTEFLATKSALEFEEHVPVVVDLSTLEISQPKFTDDELNEMESLFGADNSADNSADIDHVVDLSFND